MTSEIGVKKLKLYYYKEKNGNFGDDLNVWLWPKLVGNLIDVTHPYSENRSEETLFIGIGTLLNERIPASPSKVIFGAGAGYGSKPSVDERWKVYFVRGPLSSKILNLSEEKAITDAAVLLRLINFQSKQKLYSISFIPHFIGTNSANWDYFCQANGIHYINPSKSVEEVLADIQCSALIITEAMHGAIVADALRVPWIPVKIHSHINAFKWNDWCQSLKLEYKPVLFPEIVPPCWSNWKATIKRTVKMPLVFSRLGWVAKNVQPTLSSDRVIEEATTRLQEQLETFKDEFQKS